MRMRSFITLLLFAASAVAQDVPGSKDHPAIKRYQGSTIIESQTQNYDSLLIPTGRAGTVGEKNGFPKKLSVEGRITKLRYKAPAGRTSLEVFRNYEAALKDAGAEILFSCVKEACGDGDVFAQTLFGTMALPLTLNQKSQAYLSAKLARPTGEMYVRVFAIENRSWTSEAKTEEGQVVTQLEIVETKPMEGGMVTVDANAMHKALLETGRVALYGIYFDSGKTDVKPESKAALDEIAKLLSSHASMKLLVVGHTDTDGSFASNQDLSVKRASAVVRQLVGSYGVAQTRLTAVGVGFASPVATNRTSDGKAKNRRVELVEY